MISAAKAEEKRINRLILAAERLAAVQYQAGLMSAKPTAAVKKRVIRCWADFWTARDQLIRK